ncbi:tetratricopeptide repeat protein [Enterobacter cloacae]|uniref:tetratricopeptide repeat protein n=1 Tax=Enterobacter cloacae TaxID=550 RepID=UPI00101B1171|nr:tetratricopeptide repeat protein [Enterobacter cloacae]QBC01246.1 tetratricopeptide repeat protein [Enterobacter cloacae]
MKMITSIFFLSFAFYANAGVQIYANDTSVLVLERIEGKAGVTSTLYGGSSDSGASSPADCVIKYSLENAGNNYKGVLIPFSTEVMSYSSESKNVASFEPNGSVITYLSDTAPDICPMGTDFTGDYDLVSIKKPEYKKDFDSLIKFNYTNALNVFRSKDITRSIVLLEPYIQTAIDNNYYYPDVFNDYGFLLQQSGRNKDAVRILILVVKNTPKRTVAYLNLADAYWGIGDKSNASQNYKKYISLMAGASYGKIPSRAIERSK